MPSNRRKNLSESDRERIRDELRRDVALRQRGYRERALQLLPHLCASCGRAFSGTRMKELTVHHKDHDHANNPPDGGNWELLCIYCHDHEHEKRALAGYGDGSAAERGASEPSTLFNPFAALDARAATEPKQGKDADPK